MSDQHEGFSNYETWCVHAWFLKDQATHEKIVHEISRLRESASGAGSGESEVQPLAEFIRQLLQHDFPLADFYSVYSDLLRAALKNVNYTEIAESLLKQG